MQTWKINYVTFKPQGIQPRCIYLATRKVRKTKRIFHNFSLEAKVMALGLYLHSTATTTRFTCGGLKNDLESIMFLICASAKGVIKKQGVLQNIYFLRTEQCSVPYIPADMLRIKMRKQTFLHPPFVRWYIKYANRSIPEMKVSCFKYLGICIRVPHGDDDFLSI